MAYNLSAFAGAGAQFFDNNGVPLAGGLLYVYTAGTTTPAITWTTNSGAVANTNPIVLDAAGRTANEIWLNSGVTYKFVLKDSNAVLIGTYDNIPAIDDPTVFNNLITVTGTNTLIGTSAPPYTAYVAGMTISFVAANTNTGATTIDVDGLGAKNIYYDSTTALSAGAIQSGKIVSLEYDGTRFQIVNSFTTGQIPNGAITYAKIQNVSAGKVLGRDSSGSGVVQELPISVDTSGNCTFKMPDGYTQTIAVNSAVEPTDFNSATRPGFYRIPIVSTNAPITNANGSLLVIARGDTLIQLFFDVYNNQSVWWRYQNSTPAWSSWYSFSPVGGSGQAWTDVTASRALNTNYTNSTGKTIVFHVSATATTSGPSLSPIVGGTTLAGMGGTVINHVTMNLALVPPGAVYQMSAANNTLTRWVELR